MLRRRARRDRMLGLFAAGVVLFNPPILNLVGGTLFGWPALYLYLFLVWALLIAAVALISERGGSQADERE
jgi:uncharacterized protein (DUF58 family)